MEGAYEIRLRELFLLNPKIRSFKYLFALLPIIKNCNNDYFDLNLYNSITDEISNINNVFTICQDLWMKALSVMMYVIFLNDILFQSF